MNRVLIVCYDYVSAKRQFYDMAPQATFARASLNDLMIEIEDTQYQFISSSQVSPDRMMGRTYHHVIIDEMCELTDQQRSMIMSRKR